VAGFLLEEEEVDPQIRYLQRYGLADISHLLTDENLKGLHRGTVDIWMRRVLDESFGRISQRMQQLVLGVCVYRIPFNSAMALAQIHSLSFERDLEVSQPQNKQERSSLDSSLDSPDSLSPPFEGGLGGSKRDNLDTKSIEKDLRQLVRRSLLQEERDKDGGRWFKFQPLIQEYAKYKAGDLTQAHQRAIDYYRLNTQQPPWEKIEDITEYLELFNHWCELQQYIPALNILRYCNEFLALRGYSQIQVKLYNQLIGEWNRSKLDWVFGGLLRDLGTTYYHLGEYKKSIVYTQQSLAIFEGIGNCTDIAISRLNLGNVYYFIGDYKKSIEYHKQSLLIRQEIGNRSGIASSLSNLGAVYHFLGEYQHSIEYYQQAFEIKHEIGDRCGMAETFVGLGNTYSCLGEYQRSIEYYQKAMVICEEIGARNSLAVTLDNFGTVYHYLGQYTKAIKYFQQSLAIQREIGNRIYIACSFDNLGKAYHSLGEDKLAIEYHQQSLAIREEIRDRYGMAESLNDLGNVYRSLGEYKQAIQYYQQSLVIFEKVGNRICIAISLINLGTAYYSTGYYKQAIEYYQQSLMIFQEIGNRHEIARTLQKLAQAYHRCGRVKEGFAAAYQASQILQELGLPLDAMPYPQWLKSTIKFAQRGKLHLVLCFMAGLIAFPFALLAFTTLILWRIIRASIKRSPQHQ